MPTVGYLTGDALELETQRPPPRRQEVASALAA